MRSPFLLRRPFALALLLLGAALAGCGEAPEAPEAPPPSDPANAGVSFIVRGIYHGVLYDSTAAAVEHEAIPGLMGAMRMQLRVASPAELRGLRKGDKITFELVQPEGSGYLMRGVEKLPPETELKLAPSPPDAVPDEDALPNGGGAEGADEQHVSP